MLYYLFIILISIIIFNYENINEKKEKERDEVLPENSKTFFGKKEKSFAKVRIKPQKNICSFVDNDLLIVISYDDKYYQAEIDKKKGGICKVKEERNIIIFYTTNFS